MFSMKNDSLLFRQMEQWIKKEENDKVKFIIEHTAPTDLVSENDETLLHHAATHGNLHIVEYLNDRGIIEVDAKDYCDRTPLMLAIANKNWAVAKFLLERNADIFATDLDGESALLIIMKRNDLDSEVFKMFIDRVKSKNPNQIDFVSVLGKLGCTVDKIIYLHDVETTKVFLDWSAFAGTLDRNVEYSSVYVAMRTMDEENMKLLLHRGQVKRRRLHFLKCLRQALSDSYQDESLLAVARLATKQLVKWKLLSDENIHVMQWIIQEQSEDRLRLLLSNSLVSYVKEDLGFDIRVHMFGNRHPSVLAMIKNGEVDNYALSSQGISALHISSSYGTVNTLKYLLDCKMNPNVRDKNGKTPIFEAVNAPYRCEETLALLLLYGADIQACDYSGKTFIDFYRDKYFKIVSARLAILESMGKSLTEPFRNYIFASEELSEHFNLCCRQLEKMKTHKVHSSLTLFETVAESIENLTRRVRTLNSEVIETLFNSDSVQEYNSYYISVSKKRLGKALKISNLRNKAAAFIGDCTKILKTYDLVLNEICSYLTYYDLSFFVDA